MLSIFIVLLLEEKSVKNCYHDHLTILLVMLALNIFVMESVHIHSIYHNFVSAQYLRTN